MTNKTVVNFAFYRHSNQNFEGQSTYAGKSDGLERTFFGGGVDKKSQDAALEKCRKLMEGCRRSHRSYKLLRYEYPVIGDTRVTEVHAYRYGNRSTNV